MHARRESITCRAVSPAVSDGRYLQRGRTTSAQPIPIRATATRRALIPFGRMRWTIPTSSPAAWYGHHAPVYLVSGPVAGGRPVGVVRTAIVRVRVEPEPLEALEALTPLEPLVAATGLMPPSEFMPAMKIGRAMEPVPTIPGQRGYRHRCHCQDRKC